MFVWKKDGRIRAGHVGWGFFLWWRTRKHSWTRPTIAADNKIWSAIINQNINYGSQGISPTIIKCVYNIFIRNHLSCRGREALKRASLPRRSTLVAADAAKIHHRFRSSDFQMLHQRWTLRINEIWYAPRLPFFQRRCLFASPTWPTHFHRTIEHTQTIECDATRRDYFSR